MKALSVKNPYATQILQGIKKYEYRTWNTKHRGQLLICSSKLPQIEDMISGQALCVVDLKNVYEITKDNYTEYGKAEAPEGRLYAWEIEVIKKIHPFPVKGKLSFFEVDDDLLIDICNLSQQKNAIRICVIRTE